MPSVIRMKNGKTETVFDLDGLLYLVEQHMGDEARRLLEDFTAPEDDAAEYIDSLEKENKRLRDHHHEVMEDLRPQDSYNISAIMVRMRGWQKTADRPYLPIYGRQRVYVRDKPE